MSKNLLGAIKNHKAIILSAIILLGFIMRLFYGMSAAWIDDEAFWKDGWSRINFSANSLNLPVQGFNHPLMALYFLKLSSMIFGGSILGIRMANIILGTLIIFMVFILGRSIGGVILGLFSSFLYSLNGYALSFTLATENCLHIFFFVLTLIFFLKGVSTDKKYFIFTGISLGLGFLTKELIIFLLPCFFIFLIIDKERRKMLAAKECFFGLLLFSLLVLPYLLWHMSAVYSRMSQGFKYDIHLLRVSKIGFTLRAFGFYFRYILNYIFETLRLYESRNMLLWLDEMPEHPGIGSVSGIFLFTSAALLFFKKNKELFIKQMLIIFWFTFLFLTVFSPDINKIKLLDSSGFVDSIGWWWASPTLIPAIIMGAYVCKKALKHRVKAGAALVFLLFISSMAHYFVLLNRHKVLL